MIKLGKFGVIGVIGFLADAVAFIVLEELIGNLLVARVVAFWFAATVTWFGNRHLTFREFSDTSPIYQWAKHMAVAHIAGAINVAMFMFACKYFSVEISFFLGVIIATLINFFLLKNFVFISNKSLT